MCWRLIGGLDGWREPVVSDGRGWGTRMLTQRSPSCTSNPAASDPTNQFPVASRLHRLSIPRHLTPQVEWKHISSAYLHGWCFFDVCATWPWELMAPGASTEILGILKLPRILRFAHVTTFPQLHPPAHLYIYLPSHPADCSPPSHHHTSAQRHVALTCMREFN